MTNIKVYGIPNCGTCKKALQWLEIKTISYEFINTKEHPPTTDQIASWVDRLGYISLRNTSGLSYRTLAPTKDRWQAPEWIEAFSGDAMLLKRPLFVKDDIAVAVGFRNPTEIEKSLI